MFPLTLVDIRGTEVIVSRAASWKWMERVSRKVCTEVGSIAATCKAPRTGAEVKALGHSLHHRPRRSRLGREVRARAVGARGSGRGDPAARTRQAVVSRQGRATCSAGPPRAFCAARRVIKGLGDDRGRGDSRSRSRTNGRRLARRRVDA